MFTQALTTNIQEEPDYRCIEVELVYTCGHVDQTLEQMAGDCLCLNDPDPAHHIKDVQIVKVDTICPACEAGADETKLRARMDELEGVLHQHMADQAYEDWCAGRNPVDLPWNDVEIFGVEALEKHITYLESLLLCGFRLLDNDAFDLMQHSERPEIRTSSSKSATARPRSDDTVIHSSSEAVVSPGAQQQQQNQEPARSVAENPTSQALPPVHPRISILRGVSGLRRDFAPGVEWTSSWLSRRETNNRRNEWRRGRGM